MADMLTHTPSAKEVEVFLPLMGLRCCSDLDKELVAKRQYKPVPIKIETRKDVVSRQTTLNLCKIDLAGFWCWTDAELFELHLWTNGCVLAWLKERVEINQPCTSPYVINNIGTSFFGHVITVTY